MKVFVSWSGRLSHEVAKAFAAWLPTVIQECRAPFISSDIAKGEAWFQAITEELADSKLGVAFITNENHTSPWLHFEGGAMLTKLQKQRICPIVVDLAKTDYDGPLKNLQLTDIADKTDFFKLLATINAAGDNPLDSAVLEDTFGMRWPALQEAVSAARASGEATEWDTPKAHRTQDEKIDELLGLVREIRSSSSYKRNPSAEEATDISELNAAIMRRRMKWDAAAVAKFIDEQGDVAHDRSTGVHLGTVVDLQSNTEGQLWVRIAPPGGGEQIARPLEGVDVTPF